MTALRNNHPSMVRRVRDLIRMLLEDQDALPSWAGPWLDTLNTRPDELGFTLDELNALQRLYVGGED